MTRNYWQPGVIKDMQKYVDRCDLCQIIKDCMKTLAEKLMANNMLEESQIYLTVNFITELPIGANKNTILVVCDRLSKIVYFLIEIEKTSAKELARLFRDNVWRLHRLLESRISDKRSQIAADLTKELNRMLDIATKLSVTFYPQTETVLEVYLATKVSLFMVNYGRELRMETDIRRKVKVKKVIKFTERMRKAQEKVEAVLKKAQEKIKRQADKEQREVEVQKKKGNVECKGFVIQDWAS